MPPQNSWLLSFFHARSILGRNLEPSPSTCRNVAFTTKSWRVARHATAKSSAGSRTSAFEHLPRLARHRSYLPTTRACEFVGDSCLDSSSVGFEKSISSIYVLDTDNVGPGGLDCSTDQTTILFCLLTGQTGSRFAQDSFSSVVRS